MPSKAKARDLAAMLIANGATLVGPPKPNIPIKRPPLTNAQKQARFVARRKAKLERLSILEKALKLIAEPLNCECAICTGDCRSKLTLEIELESRQALARKALGDVG